MFLVRLGFYQLIGIHIHRKKERILAPTVSAVWHQHCLLDAFWPSDASRLYTLGRRSIDGGIPTQPAH